MSPSTPTQYVAFLRGINVGGHTVRMDALKQAFEALGFTEVETVLASGNVVCNSDLDMKKLVPAIEAKLQEVCGFAVPTIVRTMAEVRAIAQLKPFKDVEISVGTRLYVTFLCDNASKQTTIPQSASQDYQIVRVTKGEVFSVLTLSHTFRTGNLMKILSDSFGKNVTTRSWNTVYRVLKLEK